MREVKNRAQVMSKGGRGSEAAPLNTTADSALPSHAIDERNGLSGGSADLDFLPTQSGSISPLPFAFELEKRVTHTGASSTELGSFSYIGNVIFLELLHARLNCSFDNLVK